VKREGFLVGDPEDFWEEEARSEAAWEAQGEAYLDEVGRKWAEEHAEILADDAYERNYERAIEAFTSERLQSFYLKESELAVPALNSLSHAKELLNPFHKAALLFAVTAIELTVKNVLLKPIISGLVHTEDLADFIADLTTTHAGMDRFRKLLTGILTEYGGVELTSFKRKSSTKTLWEEISVVQRARNSVVHKGDDADVATAVLSISVAETLLTEIFPRVLKNLGLHVHEPITICACKKLENE
jgi:hypothetical protein